MRDRFSKRAERLGIVRKMIELGIRAGEEGRLYVGDVELTDIAVARAVGVDRRVVRSTTKQILEDPELRIILTKVKPTGASLVDVAGQLGYEVLTVAADPRKPGVIAGVTSILAEYGVVVRQALADDPDLTPEPRLTLVVDGRVPPEAVTKARSVPHVKSITLSS